MIQRIEPQESRASSARSFPSELRPILQLQRTLGNRRLEQLIQAKQLTPEGKIIGLQRKLTVSAANDQYEREADRLARQVMNTSDAAAAYSMQRAISAGEDKDRAPQPKPLAASITRFVPQQQTPSKDDSPDEEEHIQVDLFTKTSKVPPLRQPESAAEKPKPIQVKSASALTKGFETADDVETQINQSKGGGSPLPDRVRTYMESRFGADFSSVRVHTGGDSVRLNRSLSAQAFTAGREIYYGAGKSPTDLALTAHELSHVVQQTGGQSAVQRRPAPTEVLNVELRAPPKRPEMQPAVPRAVPASMRLAEEIDAANQLTDDELLKRRKEVALEAAAAANDADGAAREAAKHTAGPDAEAANAQKRRLQSEYEKLQRTLDAIEYVAKWRRLPPLKGDRFRYQETRRELANRRVNFRLMIEERVRETGSLNDALKSIPADLEEVQSIRKEADDFGKNFKGEAWLNCERMLLASQKVMFSELASYGLRREEVEGGIRRLKEGKSDDVAAQDVIDQILKLPSDKVDTKGPERKRARLVFKVRRLKERQQKVKDLAPTAGGLNTRVGEQSSVDAMNKARRELPVAQQELAAEWMEAEREHQVLAAYRGDQRDLEKIDLTKLDVSGDRTQQLMTEVLLRVLPKLYDNGRALWMLRNHRLKPMAMAPVVALTSANMFVPEGSIRAGVVRDLFDEAKSSGSSWLLTLFTVALAIVTLLPTGGMSAAILVPASIASAGLAAYSALKIYQKYEKQKLLVNTDLDLARALSNEQPSLSGFAFNLVMAGLEGVALFRLWRKAVELRKLAMERQSLREAIDEFKAIMNEQKRQADTDKFLDQVLRDTPAEKPPKTEGSVPKKLPAKPPPLKSIHLYRTREDVVKAVEKKLTAAGAQRPPGWERVIEALRANPGPNNAEILKTIEQVMGALQNPKLYAEVLGDAWQMVKNLKAADINDALKKMVLASGVKVHKITRVKLGGEFFKGHVSKNESWIDEALAAEGHGEMTHLLQDLVVDKVLGAGGSVKFRSQLLANAEGKITRYVKRGRGETLSPFTQLPSGQPLPNTMFMDVKDKGKLVYSETEMKTGDYVWRFTYDLFYEGEAALKQYGRLPQPERLRPALNEIGIELK